MRESVMGTQPSGGCTPLAAPSQFSQYPCRTLPAGLDFTGQVAPGDGRTDPVGDGDGEAERDGEGGRVPPPTVHRWLLLLAVLHVQSCTIVPLVFSFHFWLALPVQVQMTSFVPLAVPPPEASRHLVTPPMVTRSSLAAVDVQARFAPPVHVQITTCVPLALPPPLTDRHLPDTGLTNGLAVMAASAPGTSTTAATAATTAAPAAGRA